MVVAGEADAGAEEGGRVYLSVRYAGQQTFRKTTLHRRLGREVADPREHRDRVQRGAALSATPLSSSAGRGGRRGSPAEAAAERAQRFGLLGLLDALG